MHPLHGIHVPLITPFTAEGAVDADALQRLAHEVLDDGAAGLVALGTTAEASTLDDNERALIREVCAEVATSRGVPLIVGTGGSDTAATARALAKATDIALVPVPSFTRPAEAGVLEHFRHLAAHTAVPLVVYHVPRRTGRSLSVETLLALTALPQVIGVKYAVDAVDADTLRFLTQVPDDIAVLAGDDPTAPILLRFGAAGGILASAHFGVTPFQTLDDLPRLVGLTTALFAEPNPAVVKAVLHHQGRIASPAVRLPLLPASAHALRAALTHVSLGCLAANAGM